MNTDLSPTQQADILDQAADYITVHGHCKDVLQDADGRVCAVGALKQAMGVSLSDVDWGLWDIVYKVEQCIPEAIDYTVLSEWNDRPGRTQGEVEDLLRSTAKDLRNSA